VGPHGAWTTADWLPWPDDVRPTSRTHLAGTNFYVAPAPDGGRYVFALWFGRGSLPAHYLLFAMLTAIIITVIVSTHFLIRRMLHPLRGLSHGVARLSEGRFDVVLPPSSYHEFGAVTAGFNQMVARVHAMIRARDQLLLDVSHELRSPITRMKVALELLPAGDKRDRMRADLGEMDVMVTELLELERLRDGNSLAIGPHDIVPLLHEIAERFDWRAPGVRVVSTTGQIVVPVDVDEMRMVLRNLVENALKYSLPDSRPVELAALTREHDVVIRVADDGPGIPEADRPSVFEPFYRVDRSRSKNTGGYGLGLSICKRIADAHGGTIAVENATPRGAIFTLTLPRTERGRRSAEASQGVM
jgi:signal transduction histidine kinase